MSKIGRRRRQNTRLKDMQDSRHRQEREWLLHESREERLERLRTILISVWLGLCLMGAFLIGDDNGVLVWAGLSGVAMIAAYYLYSLWLERRAGGGESS
jgi:hypothetical protein